MNNRRKEVFFDMYCKTCKYYKQASYLHPCNDCLNTPYNEDSHKPVNWKEWSRTLNARSSFRDASATHAGGERWTADAALPIIANVS